MKKLWKRFILYAEIYSYGRVLNECNSMLSDEHRRNIYDAIKDAKHRAASVS